LSQLDGVAVIHVITNGPPSRLCQGWNGVCESAQVLAQVQLVGQLAKPERESSGDIGNLLAADLEIATRKSLTRSRSLCTSLVASDVFDVIKR
jgi:hypothetical protein